MGVGFRLRLLLICFAIYFSVHTLRALRIKTYFADAFDTHEKAHLSMALPMIVVCVDVLLSQG